MAIRRTLIRALIAASLMQLAARHALATDWLEIGRTEQIAMLVDLDSITGTNDGYLQVSVLYSFSAKQTDGPAPYRSVKRQELFDCDNKKGASLGKVAYSEADGTGKIVGQSSTDAADILFEDVDLDSFAGKALTTVCNYPKK